MEFALQGQQYRIAKMSVFDQLKVARKLLPLLASLLSDFQGSSEAAQSEQGAPGGEAGGEALLPKIAAALAGMSEEDTHAIVFPCLAVVSRQHGKGWTPVFSQGELMFDDIDLMVMLQLVGNVVEDNLGNFLPAAPASATADPSAG